MNSTPRINGVLGKLITERSELHDGNCPRVLVEEARRIEEELGVANKRLKAYEAAFEDIEEAAVNATLADWSNLEEANKADEMLQYAVRKLRNAKVFKP